MSAINAAPSLLERTEWWTSCVGGCVVCASPMEYPGSGSSAARRRSDVDMLLFKHWLLLPMESGHLIDRYILDNASVAADWITDKRLKDIKLRTNGAWDETANAEMLEYVDEAQRRTVPVCRDCNVAMTNVQAEITTVFYGILQHKWFEDRLVPYKALRAQRSKTARSAAKIMEAVFVFFTLVPTGKGAKVGKAVVNAD
eukprot:1805199-Rhodomonas_salina.1